MEVLFKVQSNISFIKVFYTYIYIDLNVMIVKSANTQWGAIHFIIILLNLIPKVKIFFYRF